MQFRSLSLSDLVLSKVPRLRHSRTQLVILVMRHWHSFWLFGYSLVAKTMSDNGCGGPTRTKLNGGPSFSSPCCLFPT